MTNDRDRIQKPVQRLPYAEVMARVLVVLSAVIFFGIIGVAIAIALGRADEVLMTALIGVMTGLLIGILATVFVSALTAWMSLWFSAWRRRRSS